MKFRIVLKPDIEDGGYNVSRPALPGCHSQGDFKIFCSAVMLPINSPFWIPFSSPF
ncbi:MAG: type II toxin-antitoxin system HicB family antitoxin [Desulfamplus sp.]|nr:type II toxin-antitoxin system HicB family antitoxin [Desulfamplus sp.]